MFGVAMGQGYSHFTLGERCRLRGLMEMGVGKSAIARRLGRHRSTIDRELRRNRCVGGYRPDSAERRAWARKLRGSRIARSTRPRGHVQDRIAMGWSSEQIPGRMELDGSDRAISAESIYIRPGIGASGKLTLPPDPGPEACWIRPPFWASCPSSPVPEFGIRCWSGAAGGCRKSRCIRRARPLPRAASGTWFGEPFRFSVN